MANARLQQLMKLDDSEFKTLVSNHNTVSGKKFNPGDGDVPQFLAVYVECKDPQEYGVVTQMLNHSTFTAQNITDSSTEISFWASGLPEETTVHLTVKRARAKCSPCECKAFVEFINGEGDEILDRKRWRYRPGVEPRQHVINPFA